MCDGRLSGRLPLKYGGIGRPSGESRMTAIPTFAAPLVAAFFGAAAAFALNECQARAKERTRQLGAINNAVYGLIIIFSRLLKFKKCFLWDFDPEFEQALNIFAKLQFRDSESVEVVAKGVRDIFYEISKRDKNLNEVLKPWEEIQFLNLTYAEELSFTFEGAPDLVGLLVSVRDESNQIAKRIERRNAYIEKKQDATVQEAISGSASIATLFFWHEMLAWRLSIRGHVDAALALTKESLLQLERYRKERFRKRRWLGHLRSRKEFWPSYEIDDHWQKFMPNKAAYDDIIGGVR
jgi:hypothetical protein